MNKVHRKPENCGAKSCECMISVHREARYCERSEQNLFSSLIVQVKDKEESDPRLLPDFQEEFWILREEVQALFFPED